MAKSDPAPGALIRSTKLQARGDSIFRLVPAALASVFVHVGLVAALIFLLDAPSDAKAPLEAAAAARSANTVERTLRTPEEKKKLHLDKLDSTVINPKAKDPDFDPGVKQDIASEKIVQITGISDPLALPGMKDGSKEVALTAIPKSYGQLTPTVGALDSGLPGGNSSLPGVTLPKGADLAALSINAGGNYGRTDAGTRDVLLKTGGGSPASEVAVNKGLQFLKRMQLSSGTWKLDDEAYPQGQRGTANDIAGAAFGMLPFLGRGVTTEAKIHGEDNPYHTVVQKAFAYLKSKQDKKTGLFVSTPGNDQYGAYAHALATLAICELYGMTKDPVIKKSIEPTAQKAVKYLIDNQISDGGWRYLNDKNKGDLSVAGWVIMALKSADMAGLEVPKSVMERAAAYVESLVDEPTEGYRYITGSNPEPKMSAVGLLCRQYLDGWNAANIRLIKGVENYILKIEGDKAKFRVHPDQQKSIYFFYYATQVVHHFGEDSWPVWNEAMRDHLLKNQVTMPVKGQEKLDGSWDPTGDEHASSGGRLMYTSMALLTLEVYYRHLPLYYRDLVSGQ